MKRKTCLCWELLHRIISNHKILMKLSFETKKIKYFEVIFKLASNRGHLRRLHKPNLKFNLYLAITSIIKLK